MATRIMSDTVINQAREAWSRLKSRKNWEDWLLVGEALLIGRAQAMKLAKTNKPLGTTYNRAMGAWLRENGLDGINTQERYRAILCVENREQIEAWRNGLDDAKRRRFNHPNCVWYAWKRATATSAPRRGAVIAAIEQRRGRPIYWSQDSMRRAHAAMLESRSSDLLVLTKAALTAAIRNDADLLALLEEKPTTTTKPVKPASKPIPAMSLAL